MTTVAVEGGEVVVRIPMSGCTCAVCGVRSLDEARIVREASLMDQEVVVAVENLRRALLESPRFTAIGFSGYALVKISDKETCLVCTDCNAERNQLAEEFYTRRNSLGDEYRVADTYLYENLKKKIAAKRQRDAVAPP